jgi:hypothetical protein
MYYNYETQEMTKHPEIKMKYKLQVFKDNKWQYVFCYNRQFGIITTEDSRKALGKRDLDFFREKFGNDSFRISQEKQQE